MKVDRRNPVHWAYLAAFMANVLAAIVLRPFVRRRGCVLLYGHKLAGNLKPILRELQALEGAPKTAFLTMDPAYHRALRAAGEPSVLAISPRCIPWLAGADGIITDHGLHSMQPMLSLSDARFFDVWHGIPFKGFDAEDFRVQRRYDEAWVASPRLVDLYIGKFGFERGRVHATGYARTDMLVRRDLDIAATRRAFGLPVQGPVILFAPTWKQDAQHRSVFPFGQDEAAFLGALSRLGARTGATVALRAHLNSAQAAGDHPHVVQVPYARFPDTEALLLCTDVLVCDWSSIAFDFLLLDRPTVFLDVEPPFAKGFSLDASHRFGAIVDDMGALLAQLAHCIQDPAAYWSAHGEAHLRIKAQVYGDYADGRAAERCVARLVAATAR